MLGCPYCGKQPVVEKCSPWPRKFGPAPWYVGCYGRDPEEHFVGGCVDHESKIVECWYDALTAHTDIILADLIGRRLDEPKGALN